MRMGKFTGISCACAIPPAQKDYVPISKMAPVTDQVVIGTSGTLIKWITHKKLPTREIKILVFDEADHMLSEVCFESCCILTTSSLIKPKNSDLLDIRCLVSLSVTSSCGVKFIRGKHASRGY
jgi:superfamily II DNA/RNA helicase